MEISYGALVAITVLSSIVAGQWVLIWRLLNKLLIQAHIPSLGPVMTTPPTKTTEFKDTRRKLFSIKLDPLDEG